ncbi:DUF445 family protein [Roseiarcus sp.]|uniref:DUF445 family protein n=1 Tax=Roseiarcus sp. TaxID=1969460 RepID=UPI003F945DAF
MFCRRLGLPIPHTATIPDNHHRIPDKLGEFIEEHFLDARQSKRSSMRPISLRYSATGSTIQSTVRIPGASCGISCPRGSRRPRAPG